jgi:MtaA/CmuA family methyltransferase
MGIRFPVLFSLEPGHFFIDFKDIPYLYFGAMTGKERIAATLEHRQPDSLALMPVTMMAAADAIGAAYRRYATEAAVLAEGQAAIAAGFDFDHLSVVSDPAVEAADCGARVVYYEDQPPAVDESASLLMDKAQLLLLRAPEPAEGRRMANRLRAVQLLTEKAAGEKLVEGWVEGPCAEAADLRGINRLMTDFFDDPRFVKDLFDLVTELAIRFARAQVRAGAGLIGIGDAAASLVGPDFYRGFVYPCERRLVNAVRETGAGVRLHICGNITAILEPLGSLGVDILDLDSMVSMAEAREKCGEAQVLLGNIDPVRVLQRGTPQTVRSELQECRRQAGAGYIVGAGCEVPRGTPRENLMALRDFARG